MFNLSNSPQHPEHQSGALFPFGTSRTFEFVRTGEWPSCSGATAVHPTSHVAGGVIKTCIGPVKRLGQRTPFFPRGTLRVAAFTSLFAVVAHRELRAEPTQSHEVDLSSLEGMSLEELLDVEVVTAGGGIGEERRLTIANTLVISREEIARMGWLTIAEALAIVPGIYVTDDQVTPSLSVRGVNGGLAAGSRLVKVMINGTPVNFRPELTGWLGLEYIPIEAVERIEVVQGPLSALYGANAFIATINVITLEERDSETLNVASGRVWRNAGNYGRGATAMLLRGSPDLSLMLAVSLDKLDRSSRAIEPTFPDQRFYPGTDELFTARSKNDRSQPESIYGKVRYGSPQHSAGEVMVQGGFQHLDSSPEFGVNTAMSHRSRVAAENVWSHGRHQKSWSDNVDTTLDLGFATGGPTDDYKLFLTGDSSTSYMPQFGYRSLTGSINTNISLLDELFQLRVAVDGELDKENILYYRQESLQAGVTSDLIGANVDKSELIRSAGGGVQITTKDVPGVPGLRAMGSSRVDFIDYGDVSFPAEFSWSAGSAYELSETTVLKAIAGRAFQTPSPVLMFARGGFGNANNVLGNAGLTALGIEPLVPQTVDGVELTCNSAFEELGVDLGVYFQSVADNIVFQQVGNDFVAKNSEQLKSVGSFASLRWQSGRFHSLLTAFGQLGLKDGSLDSSPPAQSPSLYGTIGAGVKVPEGYFNADALVRWAGPRGSSQSNTLVNNSVGYELSSDPVVDVTVSSSSIRLFDDDAATNLRLAVSNVFNTKYSEPGFAGFDIPAGVRRGVLELRQEF